MLHSRLNLPSSNTINSSPLSLSVSTTSSSSSRRSSNDSDETFEFQDLHISEMPISNSQDSHLQINPKLSISTISNSQDSDFKISRMPISGNSQSYKSLAILSGHLGSVSCIALCGEFILSASQGKDIIVWQQPDLRQFTKFGTGEGSVYALLTVENRVFTAHQDSKIRIWKVSRRSENVFRLVDTLPTKKDYLCKFMRQSNYVQTRRHHKNLWIEHTDSISCLAAQNGYVYSGSWDKTLKVWRIADFKCLESIKAHDDAINGLVASNGVVYSASADGKIKAWGRDEKKVHSLKAVLEGRHKDVSWNAVAVSGDGSMVFGAGSDGYVMGWQSDSLRKIFELKAHEKAVLSMCLMGEFLCTGSADRTIGIWKREINGGLFRVGIINGHEGPIKCLQASPVIVAGGFMLYSGSLDRSLRVWWIPNYSDQVHKSYLTQSTEQNNAKLL